MVVDIEKVLSTYLRAQLTSLSARVVGKTPDDRDSTPWVRVTKLDGPQDPSSRFDHLVAFYVQLDCYAGATGGQPQANLLGRRARAALETIADAVHAECVVTGAQVNGDSRIPDTDGFEPARDRVILTATVWAHPS